MDYKYIEQLLQRYWESQTSIEEENILRSFFSQNNVPAELLPYGYLFQTEEEMMKEAHLGDDFDKNVLDAIGQRQTTPAKRIGFTSRLRPLCRAAAIIAVFLSIGLAIQHGWQQPEEEAAFVALQPGDSTSIEIVDDATAETSLMADTMLTMPLND